MNRLPEGGLSSFSNASFVCTKMVDCNKGVQDERGPVGCIKTLSTIPNIRIAELICI